jgi:hypothetical protein
MSERMTSNIVNLIVVAEEAATVFESAANHNLKQGRTVFAREQQDRAKRIRAALEAFKQKDYGRIK